MPAERNVAIIGLGDVAIRRHLPVLVNHPHLKISAVAEVNRERASQVARRFSLSNVSSDPSAVITAPGTDIVALLTPPFAHAALAHAALDAGKHVFIEKPMTLDLQEAKALTEHAERAGTRVLVGFNQRHHPLAQTARDMVRTGELGTVRAVTAFLSNTYVRNTEDAWRRDPAHGGDVFFEYGVHHFDLLRFLLGAEVSELHASEAVAPSGATTVTTQLRFANGTLANTTMAEDTLEHNAIELVGDKGKLQLNLYRFDGLQFVPRGVFDGSFGLRISGAGKTFAALPAAFPRIRLGGDYVLTYRAEWDHFYNLLETNVEPLATARDGLEATRIASAARQSVTTHSPVTL